VFGCWQVVDFVYKKHLKNVGPIRYCEQFYIVIHQVTVATAATVARRLRIDVHDDYDDDDDEKDNA